MSRVPSFTSLRTKPAALVCWAGSVLLPPDTGLAHQLCTAARIRQVAIGTTAYGLTCSAPGLLQARRRALGNIQFIGFLYKQKMLTEKIMHSCITTLLAEARCARCARLFN